MAYNTKPIVTDVDGNPVSQYYNPTTDQYEPVEGSGGGNKVVLYNADGTENNSLSLIPILEKLSELTGTVIDEQTRQSNEQQRITFYNQLVEMLNTGQLKGDKGDTGETGRGLEFDWDGTRLGVRVEGDEEYIYVDLRGPQGPPGEIENLTSQHIEDTLGYLPVSPNDLEELRQEVEEAHTSLNDRLGNVENLDTTEKANLVLALNEIYQDLVAHKADYESLKNNVANWIRVDTLSAPVEISNATYDNQAVIPMNVPNSTNKIFAIDFRLGGPNKENSQFTIVRGNMTATGVSILAGARNGTVWTIRHIIPSTAYAMAFYKTSGDTGESLYIAGIYLIKED